MFYNYRTVAIMLILFGVAFLIVENRNHGKKAQVTSLKDITYRLAFWIGMFQLIAAIFPGTSRSGATIVGALLLGVSRTVAAEYTFFLAIPVMFGASLLKLVKFGLAFSAAETAILLTGMVVAFVVSLIVIRFLMGYIKSTILKCLAGIGSFLARSCFYAEYADCFRNWKKISAGNGEYGLTFLTEIVTM